MHLIPFFLMKLHDKAKVEALFKSAKTSVDASVERLIKPIIINIEANADYGEKDAQDLRIVQIALLTMKSINMGKLIQTFADYHEFDFEEEVAVAVRRNFQRSPELSEVLSGVTDQLAPIMGIGNEMVETPVTKVQKVDQVSNPKADT